MKQHTKKKQMKILYSFIGVKCLYWNHKLLNNKLKADFQCVNCQYSNWKDALMVRKLLLLLLFFCIFFFLRLPFRHNTIFEINNCSNRGNDKQINILNSSKMNSNCINGHVSTVTMNYTTKYTHLLYAFNCMSQITWSFKVYKQKKYKNTKTTA